MTDTLELDIQYEEGDNGLHFNATERAVIEDAIALVEVRFLADHVLSNALAQTPEEDEYWQFDDPDRDKWWKVKNTFINDQRETLKHRRATICLEPFDEPPTLDSNGNVTNVTNANATDKLGVVDAAEGVISGDFYVRLNKARLGNSAQFPATAFLARFWAGVIVHEMLHNLGHRHPAGQYNCHFIREYQLAVRENGRWQRPTTGYTCGHNSQTMSWLVAPHQEPNGDE